MAYVHIVHNVNCRVPKRAASVERRKLSLATLARRRGLNPRSQPVVCSRNGKWIKQSQWRRVTAKRDDVVAFVVMPRGSGLRVAAMLAVLVLATVVAGPIAGALIPGAIAGSTTLAVGTALIGAGLVLGGNYLINALLPAGQSTASPDALGSPTYAQTLSQQNNTARLNGAIPVLYGRMRFIPDLAAPGWSEWVDKVQRFHQTLILTQGSMQIEKIELGQTNIDSYNGVDYEVIEPDGTVTLFEPEVYTSQQVSGSILYAPNDPDGGAVVTEAWTDSGYVTGDVVYVLNVGNGERAFYQANTNTTNAPPSADWTDLGTTDPFDMPYMGPFPVCPPGRTTIQIGIDLALPQGLYVLNTETNDLDQLTLQWRIDCREIDDNGDPVGSWTILDSEVATSAGPTLVVPAFTNSSFLGGGFSNAADRNSPLTFSFRIQMPYEARWEVRAIRVTDKRQTGQVGQDLTWIGLKSFLGSYSYGDVTALAVRIHSTSAANNSSSHQIAVTGTRNLPFNESGTWFPPVETRAIAWALADMIRNETYGARRDDTAIDLDGLLDLHAIWEARGDTFDFYAAQRTTLWTALSAAARAGRTVPYHQSGIVRFHRDQAQTIPVQMFSSENIIKDSFVMKFSMPSPEDDVDGIEVKYVDEDTWLQSSILLPKAGVVDPISPSTTTLDGVVQSDQANNEAEYMLAADRYRRVFIEFDTEMDGLIASRGDLILVHHDTPRWGQSTRVALYEGIAKVVTLWGRLIDYDHGATYYAQIRDSLGRPSQPVEVLSYDDDFELILATVPLSQEGSPLDTTQYSEAEPLHIVVGTIDTIPRLAIFLGATPRGGKRVSVQAVLEDDNVHVN